MCQSVHIWYYVCTYYTESFEDFPSFYAPSLSFLFSLCFIYWGRSHIYNVFICNFEEHSGFSLFYYYLFHSLPLHTKLLNKSSMIFYFLTVHSQSFFIFYILYIGETGTKLNFNFLRTHQNGSYICRSSLQKKFGYVSQT